VFDVFEKSFGRIAESLLGVFICLVLAFWLPVAVISQIAPHGVSPYFIPFLAFGWLVGAAHETDLPS
jgi:hypothetical protein